MIDGRLCMLRLVYALLWAWLGLNVLPSIGLGVVMLFSRLTASEAAQKIPGEADAYSAAAKGKPMN
jgi:hypothetical protein